MSINLERKAIYVLATSDISNPEGYKSWIGKDTQFLTRYYFEGGRYKMYDSTQYLAGAGNYSGNADIITLKAENGV